MDKAIFILGPTGCGKSRMAVNLAHKFNGEIISADSVQVYKGFDIGSAKVTEKEMQGVAHHCIDICEAGDYFTVSDFVELTKKHIHEICSRGKLPIVVGGTGLYINSLVSGYNFGGTSRNETFRAELEKEAKEKGLGSLWERLHALNPETADKIDKKNGRRLIRALEIATFGEEKTSEAVSEFEYKLFALTEERDGLYARINKRVDEMLEAGLIDEVNGLLQNGAKPDSQPMRAIGYKEVVSFLQGECEQQQMTELIKQHPRNYAKRQMTYLRGLEKTQNVEEVNVHDFAAGQKQMEEIIKEWIK